MLIQLGVAVPSDKLGLREVDLRNGLSPRWELRVYACPPGDGSPCQVDGPTQQNHWPHGHILLGNAAALTIDRNPPRLASNGATQSLHLMSRWRAYRTPKKEHSSDHRPSKEWHLCRAPLGECVQSNRADSKRPRRGDGPDGRGRICLHSRFRRRSTDRLDLSLGRSSVVRRRTVPGTRV